MPLSCKPASMPSTSAGSHRSRRISKATRVPPPKAKSTAAGGQQAVESFIDSNRWLLQVSVGQKVSTGQVLAMLESMKMEILLPSPCDGVERELSL